MRYKLSIIVPIYNIEKYIEKCVESIINQRYKNYELILVNDGSTDDSLKILNKYINLENVKIINKDNGGLSDARNCGINNSSGEYLMFIDGDDFLYDDNCLMKIGKLLENNEFDIIQYKMVYFYPEKNKNVYAKNICDLESVDICVNLSKLNKNSQVSVSACDKIIKRALIVENEIYFEKGLLSEDILWSYKIYLLSPKLKIINENVYVYRQQRQGSISTVKGEKHARDLFYIIQYWLNYKYENESFKNTYYNMIAYWYLILRVNFKRDCYSEDMLREFKNIDKFMFKFNENYKVNMAYKVKNIFGINVTILVLKFYNFLKNKGIIKL